MKLKILLFIIFCLLLTVIGVSQSRYYEANKKAMDVIEEYVKQLCDSVSSTALNKKYIMLDKKNVLFLNVFYNSINSFQDFVSKSKKHRLAQTQHQNLGLIQLRDFNFYNRVGYLKISISLTTIGDLIVSKKIDLESSSKLRCVSENETLSWLLDYRYIGASIINLAEFPLRSCATCQSLVSDTINTEKLDSLAKKYPEYRFSTGEKFGKLFSELTYRSNMAYDYLNVNGEVLKLLKTKDLDEIITLLFSPNYSVAVNGYEALIYLQNKGAVKHSPEIESKFIQIKNSVIPVTIVCGKDCITTKPSYNSLNMHNTEIIKKYENSLNSAIDP